MDNKFDFNELLKSPYMYVGVAVGFLISKFVKKGRY